MKEASTKITKIDFEPLSKEVVDAAFKVHQTVGAGLLESIYEDCLCIELDKRSIPYERQKVVEVTYEGIKIPSVFKLDIVVNSEIVLELKSVEKIMPAHTAQILTYLAVGNYKTGLLINYGEPYFKQAVKRFVI